MKILEGADLSRAKLNLEKAARIAIENARCLKSQRGAIISRYGVDTISEGYNAPPSAGRICQECLREYFKQTPCKTEPCWAIHAEQRAIMNALKRHPDLRGTTMYYATTRGGFWVPSREPSCTICSKLVMDHGINFVMKTEKHGIVMYDPEEFNLLSFENLRKQIK